MSRDPARRAAAAEVLAQAPFHEVLARLRRGPLFSDEAPKGVRHASQLFDGVEYHFSVVVPDSYRADERISARIMLHGGVSTDDRRKGSQGAIDNLRRSSRVTILPSAWRERPWWHLAQVESLRLLVREVRREYNIDENRVHIAGISDGGTGAYFVAMKDPTPWSAFLPLIGHPAVLRGATREPLHLVNLRARAFFAVNTGKDPLYPHSRIAPYIRTLRDGGVVVEYHPELDFGHDTGWWPRQNENMNAFLEAHPRDPHPPSVEWATESPGVGARLHWLVIRELGHVANETPLLDWNEHDGRALFARDGEPGIARATRAGNALRLETRGIRRLELLLAPTVIDFEREVEVVVNGRRVFRGPVRPSVSTLLHWFRQDLDRTMLYGAALDVDLASGSVTPVDGGAPG
ncbi:MAG: hypothetical protein VYE73_11980 [Acidobacteriota bacterium]|nr:hypothetical protein [Acidobacteriota bacterium]